MFRKVSTALLILLMVSSVFAKEKKVEEESLPQASSIELKQLMSRYERGDFLTPAQLEKIEPLLINKTERKCNQGGLRGY